MKTSAAHRVRSYAFAAAMLLVTLGTSNANATDIYVGGTRPASAANGSYWYSDLNGQTRWSYNGTAWVQDAGTNSITTHVTNGNTVIMQGNDASRTNTWTGFNTGGTLTIKSDSTTVRTISPAATGSIPFRMLAGAAAGTLNLDYITLQNYNSGATNGNVVRNEVAQTININ